MSNPLRNQRTKQSTEEYDLELDYRGNFPIGAKEVSEATITATKWPHNAPSAIVDGSDILLNANGTVVLPNKSKITFWLRGGTNGYTYKISVLATFDNDAKLKDDVFVKVIDE